MVEQNMTKKCELTGKNPMKGHNVSHANKKTKRRFLPNLKKVKFTSELLKRILWAKHQSKKIIVIKPSIDNRYSNEKIITHNDLSHECYAMSDWETTLKKFIFEKSEVDMVFLDEIQFMDTKHTLDNVEIILNKGIDVVCAGLDQDSRGKPWETSSMLLGLSDKIVKIYGFCNVCGLEATKTYRKIEGGERTQVGAANIYEPRCLKHWEPR